MTDSALRSRLSVGQFASLSSPDAARLEPQFNARALVRRLVWKMAIATFILMAIGSATRVMNAGLACPDWPLCYGTLFPAQQMNLQVFLEWFHRLDAALIGVMAIALMGLSVWYRRTLPGWMPLASVFAFGLIGFQGVLGGLTVTEMLRFDIVTAHLGTALLFFMTLLIIGIMLLPTDALSGSPPDDHSPDTPLKDLDSVENSIPAAPISLKRIHWVGLVAALIIYLQSLSGALVGSRWALHQCLNLSSLCTVMNSHLIGVIPATLSALAVVGLAWWNRSLFPRLRTLAWWVAGLLGTQVLLGLATFRLHLQVELLTVAHQSIGAALLGTLLTIAVLGFRMQSITAMADS